jgi:hypothetical protein
VTRTMLRKVAPDAWIHKSAEIPGMEGMVIAPVVLSPCVFCPEFRLLQAQIAPGRLRMVTQFQVECLPTEHPEKLLCALCWRPLERSSSVELLYAGDLPVGIVCPSCLANPRQGAEWARRHAREVRTLAREARDWVSRLEWLKMLQMAQARANHLEKLAERIEQTNLAHG